MSKQLDRSNPIPDTTVFDGRMSRRGYRLNKLCGSLITPETRAASKADEEAYMTRFGLTAEEKALVRSRDFGGLIHAGLNIYFMLKLGACTSMTLRNYADRKQLPLERVTVRLKHDKMHATDCTECETREGKIDRIEREIELEGILDDAQRARLLDIANKCPVHRTLNSETWIPTRLAG